MATAPPPPTPLAGPRWRKECKWGNGCWRPGCAFAHASGAERRQAVQQVAAWWAAEAQDDNGTTAELSARLAQVEGEKVAAVEKANLMEARSNVTAAVLAAVQEAAEKAADERAAGPGAAETERLAKKLAVEKEARVALEKKIAAEKDRETESTQIEG